MTAARTMSLGMNEIGFLKETLHAQQELLQKLYTDLDEERESSATAADQTLSMILRLQGEKAAMEMEACQYKRIAEEKMCHAEETLETFQELIYQKEMQIASLEFQVQAYKFKLASLGFDDLASSDLQYPENMLSRKNGLVEESSSRILQRGYSLPPRVNNALSRRASTEGVGTTAHSPKPVKEKSYWEEIKKLDLRVKGFTCLNSLNSSSTPEDSLNPPASTSSIRDPSPDNSSAKLVFHENSEKELNVQKCGESQCSTIVQDVFEVPPCSVNHQGDTSVNKVKPVSSLEKQPLLSSDCDRSSKNPKDVEEIIDCERKPLISTSVFDRSSKPKNEKVEKPQLFKHPTFSVADFELKQFNRRLKQLEDERFMTTVCESNEETGNEELKLLREIIEKVEALQSELTSWRTLKPSPSPPQDRPIGCFKEVMLCFLP